MAPVLDCQQFDPIVDDIVGPLDALFMVARYGSGGLLRGPLGTIPLAMPLPQVRPPAERIAGEIVRRITSGELKPGDRIVEQALADEFQTSRGPVRDALQTLNARNWIELVPRQGARVARRDLAPTLETVLIGGSMLGLAFRFAIMKSGERELNDLVRKIQDVVRIGRARPADPATFGAAVREAGNFAVQLADNRCLDDVVGPVPQGALSSYIPVGVHGEQAMEDAVNLWVELATAVNLRDQLAAEMLGKAMTERAFRRILEQQLTGPD